MSSFTVMQIVFNLVILANLLYLHRRRSREMGRPLTPDTSSTLFGSSMPISEEPTDVARVRKAVGAQAPLDVQRERSATPTPSPRSSGTEVGPRSAGEGPGETMTLGRMDIAPSQGALGHGRTWGASRSPRGHDTGVETPPDGVRSEDVKGGKAGGLFARLRSSIQWRAGRKDFQPRDRARSSSGREGRSARPDSGARPFARGELLTLGLGETGAAARREPAAGGRSFGRQRTAAPKPASPAGVGPALQEMMQELLDEASASDVAGFSRTSPPLARGPATSPTPRAQTGDPRATTSRQPTPNGVMGAGGGDWRSLVKTALQDSRGADRATVRVPGPQREDSRRIAAEELRANIRRLRTGMERGA